MYVCVLENRVLGSYYSVEGCLRDMKLQKRESVFLCCCWFGLGEVVCDVFFIVGLGNEDKILRGCFFFKKKIF